jgi:hypothetical protein
MADTTQIADPNEAAQWYKIITDFPDFFANYQTNYQGLVAQGPYLYANHPEWKADYDALLNSSTDTYNKLFAVQDSIASIKGKWSDFTGWLSQTTGFGFLPLVWVGISAASAAALIYEAGQLLSQMADRAARYKMAQDYEAKGMTPAQAALQVKGVLGAPGSGGTFLGISYTVWIIGAVALFFAPMLLKKVRGG